MKVKLLQKNQNKIAIIVVLLMLLQAFLPMISVFAVAIPILEIRGGSDIQNNYIVFKNSNEETIGKIGVKYGSNGDYLPINDDYTVELTGLVVGDNVILDLIPEEGYEVNGTAFLGGNSEDLPGADETTGIRSWGFDIQQIITIIDGITFQEPGQNNPQQPPFPGDPNDPQPPFSGDPNDPQPPMFDYDLVAYFEGVEVGVSSDEQKAFIMPENWTSGDVTFYAKVCEVNGEVRPYYNGMECDSNSIRESKLDIEGIANGSQINNTVSCSGTYGNMKVVVSEEFNNYGRLALHLANGEGINTFASVNSRDLIFIKAEAPFAMSHSFGTVATDNAILTNIQTGNVSIFFGNTETTLVATGTNIKKISNVTGGTAVALNEDGSATVTLPSLSTETTTRVIVELEKNDNTKITKTINIVRTAITLQHNNGGGDNTVYAGYVVNKNYLYGNQNHNDAIFNAYLQVMIYKDDVVVGYKQIKIDDEELINSLAENESGSLELYSEHQIPLYGKETNDLKEGVNKVSVFLTDGPIDFSSETLPSIEFGIGSGVTLEWGNI